MTPEERAIKTAYLAAAEQAYHDYRIGGQVRVYVDQNGERLEYSGQNIGGLRAYILELKVELGLNTGIVGPLNVWVL